MQRLWTALTGDTLTAADGWSEYKGGVKLRNDFAHRAQVVPHDEAERFIDAAQKVVTHVADVMANLTVSEIARRSS